MPRHGPPDINHRHRTSTGRFAPRYTAFLETLTHRRPRLRRYRARMTGSVLDAEEVTQEALFEAYRKLDTFLTKGDCSNACPD
ncbi:MAG TPA: sigma factor [Xanthobacteraceae bacterium]|nr:sigma factor [Xanthobacteraceae bacterium]